MMKLCKARNCDRPSRAANYCTKHYQRLKLRGTVEDIVFEPTKCKVATCNHPSISKGYCNRHYLQTRIHGVVVPERTASIKDGIARIPLGTGGKQGVTIVDERDAWVDKYYWCNHHGYAEGLVDGKYTSIHRLIMKPPSNMQVDHINMQTLDNRRSNLRICAKVDNSRNSGKHRNNPIGYKGVVMNHGRYAARIGHLGKKLHLGNYDTPEGAAKAYDKKALELHGDFALLNFPIQ